MSKNKRDKREEEMKKYAKKERKNFLDASYVPGTLRVEGSYDQQVTWLIKVGAGWVRIQFSWEAGERANKKEDLEGRQQLLPSPLRASVFTMSLCI